MSVEQKIREVLEDIAIEYGEYPSPDTINVDKATQAILQILESDVIEPIEKGHGGGNWRRLVVQVRANLREDKS